METESAIMETLTEDQQMQVYNLMAMGNIEDMSFAAHLLIESNFDVNKAAQKMIDMQSGIDSPGFKPQTSDFGVEGRRIENPVNPVIQPNKAEDDMHALYRKHLEKKEREGQDDPLKKGILDAVSGLKNVYNTVVPVNIRGETAGGEQFSEYLKKNYEGLSKQLKANRGTFEENIHKASEYKKPLLVYVHIDIPENEDIPRRVLGHSGMINLINNKFYFLGLLAGTEGAQAIAQYVDITTQPVLAVFRANLVDDVQLMESFTLTEDTNVGELVEHLRNAEGSFYFLMVEEEKVKNEVKNTMEREKHRMEMEGMHHNDYEDMGYHHYEDFDDQQPQVVQPRPPISREAQEKLDEARILRQIQEEEYKEVERKIKEKQQKDAEAEAVKRRIEIESEHQKAEKEKERKKSEEEKEEQRYWKLLNLPQEPPVDDPKAISIGFRLPSGDRIERRFRNSDRVLVLYDFIDSQEIVFDKSTKRYDLIQPRPFLVLEDKKKTINDYFEGSNQELLQVREHSD